MKLLLSLIIGIIFSQSAFADEIQTKRISLRQKFVNTAVNMWEGGTFDEAKIIVSIEGAAPEAFVQKEYLARCEVKKIYKTKPSHLKNRAYVIQVGFDPEIEDGINYCVVTVRQPNGKSADVTLFINVDNEI